MAGFISTTLLERHTHFEGCPALAFANGREGFTALLDRIRAYVPLQQAFVLVEKTGHYHLALLGFLQEQGLSVHVMHVQRRRATRQAPDTVVLLSNTQAIPVVPSAVPYEVGRGGNNPSKALGQ